MKTPVTIAQIADELGLSRNTVSKVLNGKKVPQKTRDLVYNKVIETGYKGLDIVLNNSERLRHLKILLLTAKPLANLNFFLSIVRGIESTIKQYDFELLQYTFNDSIPNSYKDLGNFVQLLNVDGIICIESFDLKLINEILKLKIPVIFIDFAVANINGTYDIIIMENMNVISQLCNTFIKKAGIKTFGFVGDYMHCRGFYERFIGMKEALFQNKIEYNPNFSITKDDSFPYCDYQEMKTLLEEMEVLPECFICANDPIAISVIHALKELNYDIPRDISVIGFDNNPETRISSPSLTTINVDKNYLGKQAINNLIYRIKHPNEKNRTVYINTNIVYRESSKKI